MSERCRPLLSRIQEDFPKIKSENIQVIDGTINYLFALLNIQFKPEEKSYRDTQTLVLSEFLVDRFKHLTLEEVKQAFKMYAAKEFPQLKTFRILDCISLGEILSAYIERRNEDLHVYNQKKLLNRQNSVDFKPSVEEIKQNRITNLRLLFDSLKSKKTDYSAFIYYDELKAKGKVSQNETLKLYDIELKIYEQELKEEVLLNSNKKIQLTNFYNENAKSKWNPVVVSRTKSAAVSLFLKGFSSIDDFLKVFEE